jgi:predicted transcriptional regulator YdeE
MLIQIEEARIMNQHNEWIEPLRVVEKDQIQLIGITVRTTNERELTGNGKIPALWGQFWGEQALGKIPNHSNPTAIYGCYAEYESDHTGEYTLLIGANVSTVTHIPEGMHAIVLPPAKYAVFTTPRGSIMKEVPLIWQSIWAWAATSSIKRTYTGDFELYDERSANPDDGQVDIYIAIQ